jgi:hypothetical protein
MNFLSKGKVLQFKAGRNIINKSLNFRFYRNFCEKNSVDKNSSKETKESAQKIGLIKKIKNAFKIYGKFGLILYTTLYIGGFAGFYYLIENNVIKKEQVISGFEKMGLDKFVDVRQRVKDNPKSANAVLAYVINYAFEIVRIPGTLIFLKYYFKKFRK